MNDEALIKLFREAAWKIDRREFNEIDAGTHISDLEIDSVAMLEIFGYVEEELDVYLPDDELQNVETLGDLSVLIQKKL